MFVLSLTITDNDDTYKKIRAGIQKAGGRGIYARAGLLEPEASKSHDDSRGLTNGALGLINEFGDGHIPSRSFMRAPFDANRSKYLAMLEAYFTRIYVAQYKVPDALLQVARQMAKDMRAAIRSGLSPALARGRGRVPLLKSRQLHNAIRGEVVVNGKPRRA